MTFKFFLIFLFLQLFLLFPKSVILQHNFENILEYQQWSWWSRDNTGKAELNTKEIYQGKNSVLIEYPGDKDWNFSLRKVIFNFNEHKIYKATVYVKVITGKIGLSFVGLKNGKQVRWDIGSRYSQEIGEWHKITVLIESNVEVNEAYLRLIGREKAQVYIDNITVEPWEVDKIVNSPINGYAEERIKENLDRGLIAIQLDSNKVYLSWRLFQSDPQNIAFNIYRQTNNNTIIKINEKPVQKTTDFIDNNGNDGFQYFIQPVINNNKLENSKIVRPIKKDQALSCKIIHRVNQDEFKRIAVADLNGDGSYDYIVISPDDNVDPGTGLWWPSKTTFKLEAYLSDGTFLWQYDLGWSIETGIWYAPYIVYDFNGDSKAEVVVKIAEGDFRDKDGRVQSGHEYLAVLDGISGKVLSKTDWPSRDGYADYNRASRNQLGVAYLDGKTPCIIVERGTYGLIRVEAYQFYHKKLIKLWTWTNEDETSRYWGQGAHFMHGADVDQDGRDEVIIGSTVIDDNGTSLWTTGLGHPDACYVGEIDPKHSGFEIYYGMEIKQDSYGMCLVDAKTGKFIWGIKKPTVHIHGRGICSDILPDSIGCEFFGMERHDENIHWFLDNNGKVISNFDFKSYSPITFYWDDDHYREFLYSKYINNYKTISNPVKQYKIEGTVVLVADLLGDWREEVVTSCKGQIRIYMTTIPAKDRCPCLMEDPIYRLDTANNSSGYMTIPLLTKNIANEK